MHNHFSGTRFSRRPALAGALLAALLLPVVLSGCGRDLKSGATDINRSLATPNSQTGPDARWGGGLSPYGAVDGANTGIAARSGISTDTRVEQSQAIANAVAALDEVKTANVLLMNNNAYVAVTLHYGSAVTNLEDPYHKSANIGDVSDRVKAKIAEKAKGIQPGIREVYVSANPDFVERMNVFSQHLQSGRPAGGFLQEFGTLVNRLFPSPGGQLQRSGASPSPAGTQRR